MKPTKKGSAATLMVRQHGSRLPPTSWSALCARSRLPNSVLWATGGIVSRTTNSSLHYRDMNASDELNHIVTDSQLLDQSTFFMNRERSGAFKNQPMLLGLDSFAVKRDPQHSVRIERHQGQATVEDFVRDASSSETLTQRDLIRCKQMYWQSGTPQARSEVLVHELQAYPFEQSTPEHF